MDRLRPIATYSKPLTSSSNALVQSTQQRAEKNRLATERARLLLGQFRKGEAVDPGAFVTSVAAVLARYSSEIMVTVTDPRTGLASTTDWLPTIREITVACEKLAVAEALREKREKIARETIVARETCSEPRNERPTLDELREKHGPNWGFKAAGERQIEQREDVARRASERTERAILAEYERIGIDPVYAGDVLVSPGLARSLGRIGRDR